MRGRAWLVLWSLWATRLVRQPTAEVRTSGGLVRGSVAPDGSHKRYFGIPYASNDWSNRFKAPGPAPLWDGILEADREDIRCLQGMGDSGTVMGEQQCLTLNVYTPIDSTPDTKYPVMVFIHGGGFIYGSGLPLFYGPKFLVTKGVILVTLNYRLFVQGFLCLGIKEAPGNAGLKDQSAALKWIQKNIKSFGGDPDNVTLFGESAGSASVSYHLLSPMSKGLFHKAILQSGSSLSPWSLQTDTLQAAQARAEMFDFHSDDPYELYNFFMSKTDAELVASKLPRSEGNIVISEIVFSPCVEKNIDGVEPFLSDMPYNLLSTGNYNKVPMMIGSNTQEGYLMCALDDEKLLAQMKFNKSLPKNLAFDSDIELNKVAEDVKQLYLGADEIRKETYVQFSKYYTEPFFTVPAAFETELIVKSNNNPVYNYLFNFDGWKNVLKFLSGRLFMNEPGATHGDELFYIFSQYIVPPFEMDMANKMATLWSNFAKFGDPTPKNSDLFPVRWKPVDRKAPESTVIESSLRTVPLWYSERLKYWDKIYRKYRRK